MAIDRFIRLPLLEEKGVGARTLSRPQSRFDSADATLMTPETPNAPQGVPAGRSEVVEGGDG